MAACAAAARAILTAGFIGREYQYEREGEK